MKNIFKYLRRTKDVFLVYGGSDLKLEAYSDSSFQLDPDDSKSIRVCLYPKWWSSELEEH